MKKIYLLLIMDIIIVAVIFKIVDILKPLTAFSSMF